MPYEINKTNGGRVATVGDGVLDNSTSLTLIGKNYSGYGEILNENLVKLMENFSDSSAPANAMTGQLWWDSATKSLKVNTAATGIPQWKIISGATAGNEPANKTLGDIWFDTLAAQLKVYNGTTWTLIGPSYSAGTGTSGAVVDSVLDSIGTAHVVVKYLIGGEGNVVAILSKDTAFQPQTNITGFSTINPGITMSSTIGNAGFYGTASNADKLDSLNSTQFMRSDANTSTSGTLGVTNDSGVSVGVDGDLRLSVSGSDVYIANNTSNGDVFFRVNKGGVATDVMFIDGQTGEVRLPAAISANNNSTRLATTAYVDAQAVAAASSSGFASGTTMLFVQSAAPTGWTKSTTHDNKALRIVSGTASSGGSVAFTAAFTSQTVSGTVGYQSVSGTTDGHVLLPNEMPSHSHFIAGVDISTAADISGSNYMSHQGSYGTQANYRLGGSTVYPTEGITSSAGGGGAHSHTFTSQGSHNHSFSGNGINLAVAYVDAIIAVKN